MAPDPDRARFILPPGFRAAAEGSKRMKTMKLAAFAGLLSVGAAQPSLAKKPERTYPMMNEEMGVPVFPYDIKDRPYEVLGEVKAGVRKATVFSHEASQKKIYKELWERGEKLGAD